jgi:hypothetical protein
MTDVRARPPTTLYTPIVCIRLLEGVLSTYMSFDHGPYYSLDPVPDHGVALQGVQWIAICLDLYLKFIARLRTYGCSQPPKVPRGTRNSPPPTSSDIANADT